MRSPKLKLMPTAKSTTSACCPRAGFRLPRRMVRLSSKVQQPSSQGGGNLSRERRFSDSQSACFPVNDTRVGHSPTDYSDPSQLAEAFACTIDEPCERDILELISLLPTEVPARGAMQAGAHSFTTGAFSKPGSTGLRRHCADFPRTTEALTRFVRKRAPDLEFGAVALFTNLEADFHQDVNNCPSSVNWVHPLSSFSDGGIWVESPAGDTVSWARGKQRSGSILPVANGPVTFNSQKLHRVMPWSNGPRSVIVAFTPASQRQLLVDAGFRLSGNKPMPGQEGPPVSSLHSPVIGALD